MSLAPRDLQYFLQVARMGQLARAATSLEVTSAALSKSIRRLEDALGLRLFERSGEGMTLTPFGESFRDRAERMTHEHDEALRHAGDVRAGRSGLLRLGATIAVLDPVVSPALAYMQPKRPALHAVLTVATSDELLERTRRGTLDAAIVPSYDRFPHGLLHIALGTDPLVPVAREDHPIFGNRRVRLDQLAACSWVLPRAPLAARSSIEAAFTSAGLPPPEPTVEVDFNSAWALPLLAATDLVGLVPRSALRTPAAKGIRIIEAQALHLPREIGIFYRSDVHWSPLMEEFAQALSTGIPTAATGRRQH